MKTKSCLILGAALLALLAGCASAGPALVLAPVGPAPRAGSPQGSRGALVVYSAFNTGVPNPSLPDDFRPHTDYELRAEDGKLLQRISNQAAARSEDPATVPLTPGKYRVVARANGYGRVTVPVVIVANRVTEVHLEGGSPRSGRFSENTTVRLPDGEVVGWQATEESTGAGRQ
jgi:hypothetical protein